MVVLKILCLILIIHSFLMVMWNGVKYTSINHPYPYDLYSNHIIVFTIGMTLGMVSYIILSLLHNEKFSLPEHSLWIMGISILCFIVFLVTFQYFPHFVHIRKVMVSSICLYVWFLASYIAQFELLSHITFIFLYLVLFTCCIMMFYSGLKYASSSGDPKSTEQAKMLLVWSGTSVIFTSYMITVINVYRGFDFSTFSVLKEGSLYVLVICVGILFLTGLLHIVNEKVLYRFDSVYYKIQDSLFWLYFLSVNIFILSYQILFFFFSFF